MASLKELYEESLKTGKFTVNYQFFGSPTIVAFQPEELKTIYSDWDDRVIRGGLINAGIASARDTAKITKFFTGADNKGIGPLFLTKQVGLQLTNPNTSFKATEGNSAITSTQTYNLGVNTLASVAGNAFGLHFDRHGSTLTFDNDPYKTPGYITDNLDDNGNIQSRLVVYKDKILPTSAINGDAVLNKYNNGPNSYLGIGTTTTRAYKNSLNRKDGVTNVTQPIVSRQYTTYANTFNPFSYEQIQQYSQNVFEGVEVISITEQVPTIPGLEVNDLSVPDSFFQNKVTTAKITLPGNNKIQDFRKAKNDPNADNYPINNVHNRIGVTTGRDAIGTPNTVDSINLLTITPRSTFYYNSNSAKEPGIPDTSLIYTGLFNAKDTADKISGKYGRDIIKFRIELLNNDIPIWPTKTTDGVVPTYNSDVLAFRAYLNNINDNFTSNWKEFNYMGRGESFYAYENYKREIQFSFILLAHSEEEMPAIYTKLNYLMSSFAPDYNTKNQMRGTYAYLTIGDYVYQQPGIFTSMQITDLLEAPWEIALNEPENRLGNKKDARHHEVPKYMKVQMNFKPIHNFLPRKNSRDKDHTATFITPNWAVGNPNRYLPQTKVTAAVNQNGQVTETKDTRILVNTRPPYPNPTTV